MSILGQTVATTRSGPHSTTLCAGVLLRYSRVWNGEDGLELPGLAESAWPGDRPGAVGLAFLHNAGGGILDLDLLVHADRLQIGFATANGELDLRSDRAFAIAIPPGAAEVRPVSIGPQSMYYVRVRLPLAFDTGSACFEAQLVIRAEEGDGVALLNRYWEFGRCE